MSQHKNHSADNQKRTTGGVLDWIDYRLPIFTFLRREGRRATAGRHVVSRRSIGNGVLLHQFPPDIANHRKTRAAWPIADQHRSDGSSRSARQQKLGDRVERGKPHGIHRRSVRQDARNQDDVFRQE